MGSSFIRYYVSDIPFSLAEQLQHLLTRLPELKDWQWILKQQFDYKKGFGFLPGTNVSEVECIIKRCSAIIEHRNPGTVIGSFIWKSRPDSPATVVDDILTICSVAKAQYIYARAQEVLEPSGKLRIVHRPDAPASDLKEVIPEASLGAFIIDGLSRLKQQNWKENIGFDPAIHWYAQAQRLFRAGIFPLELSLYWIVLEVLARVYIQHQGLLTKIRNKADRVKEFIDSRGFKRGSWSFLDAAIGDWYKVRCAAFHEGELPVWSQQKFEQRWRQLAEFTSFVLADLLQPQSHSQKDQIGMRLSGY